ncbi:bifunctional UDP-N-acetylglucosamine diphosphorylase/glucosamine-1-phosphate N-acetyltransferase GlmU [Candidatus Atelocyanobacterium thalassae]|uniref:Bifunctional protein GlmU n=1 Tax=Atelocyanobacterium thalassa (isolate ALOHA) TaxID=1453429 RepID=D3EMX1_ATETH|nr:bifunctional UDP-N-acetylglucosamine diphosphorylase/glucosamine-1-phosphate N-acetyltransferase GlmU [Candidatus Atelocyanobacterium thalassa]ADB94821.1 UDP-N-acetylglucosamine pyrophosphorylase /glucosamine-1-phosphate N-acetyltransferase [Candidatus Atelocyanobacterium thalassa isolate ALOHA]MCH2543505.1 bifunctional UDP-N-acetylglucosamine diphosphorylase/glucosamine-1-phosphate N-acetyltransferase GlmU [Candidatus Atelocyanobacterium sp. ALOHA_A2.5_9]|tara:strand:- start:106380 stop:107732 length:1353 start_codon:yes stop_codon:yes gene_type:complete
MTAVAILAAGRGTRMKSNLPKVLHTLGGQSLVQRVLNNCSLIAPSRQFIVIGFEGDKVKQSLAQNLSLKFVEQKEQLGTGHAVQQLLPYLQDFKEDLLVLNGDVPLLRPKTLQNLLSIHKNNNNAATVLTANLPNPKGYGRVFCDGNNLVTQIIEDRDCNSAQQQNCRVNGGIYCFNWAKLAQILPHLSANNQQKEYYLTDVAQHLEPFMAVDVEDYFEINGINNRQQLSDANNILQDRIKKYWMNEGVTMINPQSISIDDTVSLSPDTVIEPQTHLRGKTYIGSKSHIGPGTFIEDSKIGEHVNISYSVVSHSEISSYCQIGPYAHIRKEVKIHESCRIGNFVEIKKSQVEKNSNIAHLSYIGDASLGEQVNIGAGTITANYDGVNKHPTIIGSQTKTGANSVFVAPVTLGNNVTVAAGSVVTNDVPDNALVIARQQQKIIKEWKKTKK